jgi:hypothetical protein
VKIWQIFVNGFGKVNQNKRMLFILFGIQFVFALILLLPLRSELSSMLNYSLMGQDVLNGKGSNVFIEFITHHNDTVSAEKSILFGIGLLYLLATIFVNGGILGIFTKKAERFSAKRFFENSGHYFGKFLRLFLISLVFMIISFFIFSGLLSLVKVIAGDSEILKGILNIIVFVKLIFLLFFVNMVFDYAKIRTVIEERKDMVRTGLRSWRFVFKHLGKTLGIYYLIVFEGLLVFLLFLFVGKWIHGGTGAGILLLFAWQQIYAILRMWIRLQFYASQTLLYQSVSST